MGREISGSESKLDFLALRDCAQLVSGNTLCQAHCVAWLCCAWLLALGIMH